MTIENVATNRQRFRSDHHRPRYHYLPPSGWINDPNGVIQWEGRYHLFYQYNPNGAYHANIVWGHSVSDDLIHWEDLPVALRPTPNSIDEGGIFSGCIVNHDGIPKLFYTGVNPDYSVQRQCLATSNDGLLTWEKHEDNPVIAGLPQTLEQTIEFRDPFVWREGDMWYMLLGSCIAGIGGTALLYRSSDLIAWEYLNPILVGDMSRNGVIWECPNFFPIGDKWVLIVSMHSGYTTATVMYFVGTYENHRFTPEYEAVLDAGYYYAPLTFLDDHQHRVMHGWVREGRSDSTQKAAGWSGAHAIPRNITLDDQNRLIMQPVPELEKLRGAHYVVEGRDLTDELLPVKGLSLEIRASFTITDEDCGIIVAASSDGTEQTRIYYDVNTSTLRVKREYAKPDPALDTTLQGTAHRLDEGETLDLLILLDGSVLEIIANGRTSLTSRIYPENRESQHIKLINPRALNRAEFWELSSIW